MVEYAKAAPEDLLIRVTIHNRGPEAARLHVLPTVWFRNTWSWGPPGEKPNVCEAAGALRATHPALGTVTLACDGTPELLFTENESNTARLWGQPNATPWVKDAFHRYVVQGEAGAVNPARSGTKAAARYVLDVSAHGAAVVRLRWSGALPAQPFGADYDATVAARLAEAVQHRPRAVASLADGMTAKGQNGVELRPQVRGRVRETKNALALR